MQNAILNELDTFLVNDYLGKIKACYAFHHNPLKTLNAMYFKKLFLTFFSNSYRLLASMRARLAE
ncbi:hypothetical protein F904_01435 [Acinetobacter dispersus]|uniref:Uncharacterized protein n=1 Tax=Acinetobacter dispersus TaxID=70348 RepID=N9MTV9_9GAMM|nr:hypothetical protein F904_01435 [Acinetobacter dispersus]